MNKTVLIAQARMGSTRLPGKVLKLLGNQTVIEHAILRTQTCRNTDDICIATTEHGRDDCLVNIAEEHGCFVFRGSEMDVLSRFAEAARKTKADIIVRITCDCPLIDPKIIDNLINLRQNTDADYASNGLIMDWPDGLGCEVFTTDMLFLAEKHAQSDYDREHVTPYIRRKASKTAHLSGPGMPFADHRWTLDTEQDYAYLSALIKLLPQTTTLWHWQEIMDVVEANPHLKQINHHLRRREMPK